MTTRERSTHRNASSTRRKFLATAGATAAGVLSMPYFFTGRRLFADDAKSNEKNDRPVLGCIGTGDRWQSLIVGALEYSDCAAVCDVDTDHAAQGKAKVQEVQDHNGRPGDVKVFEDYRRVLDRADIDTVLISTPDHWHAKIAIAAMQAGKDVYCEKPLTLTIDEGKQILKVLKQTGRVFQVGTQQRSEMKTRDGMFESQFILAVALCRNGRLGEIKRVECTIGASPTSEELPEVDVPSSLNWDMWLGQAPLTPYLQGPIPEGKKYPQSRAHYEYRWWYEYSGGKMTDWGAHHVDIAQWAIGMEHSGPLSFEGTATHPVPFKDGYPTITNRYNTAIGYLITAIFPNGVELTIRDGGDNGILIEGTKGRIFVNRGSLKGKPVEDLAENPLPEDALVKLYKGHQPGSHMRNFFECVKTREQPISDVASHHRSMTTCHLANIAIRLGRKLKWNPETEQIEGDEEAAGFLKREQRKGYEILI